jgi:hypothetical protein
MEDNAFTVVAKETSAFINGWRVWGTARISPIFSAAKHAFHPYPFRNHNPLWVDPFEILETMPSEHFFKLLLIAHLDQPLDNKHHNCSCCSNSFS